MHLETGQVFGRYTIECVLESPLNVFVSRGCILGVVMIGATALGAACSDGGSYDVESGCKPYSRLRVFVPPESVLGVVTTQGACTDVQCAAPDGSGCRLWEGEMTSENTADRCLVVLTLPDGRRRELVATPRCQGPELSF